MSNYMNRYLDNTKLLKDMILHNMHENKNIHQHSLYMYIDFNINCKAKHNIYILLH